MVLADQAAGEAVQAVEPPEASEEALVVAADHSK